MFTVVESLTVASPVPLVLLAALAWVFVDLAVGLLTRTRDDQ